jgi:hypothetical protein
LYTGYQVMFENERERDFRFFILVTRWYLKEIERETRFCILVTRWYLRKRERETFGFAH